MKGQLSLEAFLVLAVFFALAGILVASAAESASVLEQKRAVFDSKLKADQASVYCNLLYLKSKSVEISSFPALDADDSMINCFSDSYYFNQAVPKVGGVRLWF